MLAQLRPYVDPFLEFEEQIEVAGETHHVKGIKGVYKAVGMPITAKGSTIETVDYVLLPEPWNEHDPNAVAVLVLGHHVGYVPAEDAKNYAAGLGRLAAAGFFITGTARIWAKSDSGMVRARVTILAPESDDISELSF